MRKISRVLIFYHIMEFWEKTGRLQKLRIVLDGSARGDKNHYSLNDCLEKGPNLTPHVFEVLGKFRSYPVGLTADIEKAFHQISVNPADRDHKNVKEER